VPRGITLPHLQQPEIVMKYAPIVGRVLFSVMFIMFGMNHMTAGDTMNGMVPSFLPFPGLIVLATGVLLIVGGIAVLVGYKTKLAALALAVFLLATTFLTWAPQLASAGDNVVPMTMFLRDMSLAGAALLVSYFGAGPMSLDAKAEAKA
jgi:putative oxidoreductase